MAFINKKRAARTQLRVLGAGQFAKWVGGKWSISYELSPRPPSYYAGYYEPFLGGGALVFAAQQCQAYLLGVNPDLVMTFQAVHDDIHTLLKHLEDHARRHAPAYYLKPGALFIMVNESGDLIYCFRTN